MYGVFIWYIGITQLISVRCNRRGNQKRIIHGHKQHWAQDKERKQTKWKAQLKK